MCGSGGLGVSARVAGIARRADATLAAVTLGDSNSFGTSHLMRCAFTAWRISVNDSRAWFHTSNSAIVSGHPAPITTGVLAGMLNWDAVVVLISHPST